MFSYCLEDQSVSPGVEKDMVLSHAHCRNTVKSRSSTNYSGSIMKVRCIMLAHFFFVLADVAGLLPCVAGIGDRIYAQPFRSRCYIIRFRFK